MTTTEQILSEFIDAWSAGRRPDVHSYLQRAPTAERAELAAHITTWLRVAPTPEYDDATRKTISQEPLLVAAREAAALARSPLSAQLPTLRERAGLAIRDVAGRLVTLFDLDDEQRTADYLERVERDELDASRLSRRLLDGLAVILGADRDQLTPGRTAFAGGQSFFRAEDDADQWIAHDIDALPRRPLPRPRIRIPADGRA